MAVIIAVLFISKSISTSKLELRNSAVKFIWGHLNLTKERFFKGPAIERIVEGPSFLMAVIKHFPFNEDFSLKEWEEKVFNKKVNYRVLKNPKGEGYVLAESSSACSGLYYKVNLSIRKEPVISWKWRVEKFPMKKLGESISLKKEEDFAARIYVIFPAAFFTNTKAIEYIWSETLPEGTSGNSAYTKNIKVLVLKSGKLDGQWKYEERNIYEDYKKLFGEEPRLDVGAIAFMTDSDSTRTEAIGQYDEIKVGYKDGKIETKI